MPHTAKLRLAVTGEASFARRHGGLFSSLAGLCERVDFVTSEVRVPSQRYELAFAEVAFAAKQVLSGELSIPFRLEAIRRARRRFLFSRSSFERKSIITERNLLRLDRPPEVVLHIFGLYRPFWTSHATPYVYYLDYTTALARRNWPPNVPALSGSDYAAWFGVERDSYQRAAHLFPMSELVASSLTDDYGVAKEKITVVGSGGRLRETKREAKRFGSKMILFNGNPFVRKGGDLTLAAFEIVRERMPEATLVVLGTKIRKTPHGVINPGFIADHATLSKLFREADLVVAPALADPFPGFLIEAMSYGVPCIASDVDGMPEIVDDGLNGTILRSPLPVSLADAITSLLGDPASLEAYSREALRKANASFEWPRIAHQIVGRLESIVSNAEK